jgi:hypothetical protein
MGKEKKKKNGLTQDLTDNNYLVFDSKIPNTMLMCGLATGISCIFFGVSPIAILLYMIAVLERTRAYINQSTFILIVCGLSIVGSLAASIVAKVRCRASKWAVTNIIFISINLVKTGLVAWFFIWLMNTYGNG